MSTQLLTFSAGAVILLVILQFISPVALTNENVQLSEPVHIQSSRTKVLGLNGTAYQSFVGIPFAEPPIGKLRFANPKPTTLPRGEFKAVVEPPQCIQLNFLLPNQVVMGEEDCLYLNVYRPHKTYSRRSKLPVMVYIHGGAFFSGTMHSAIVGPRYFMETGEVILVVIQYRLSTLGFLSTGDESSPGNFGLKDQSFALKWVKENIEAFGGDPNAITIFGQSAGAASVHMHMMSPLSKNLFNQAIAMSGNAIAAYNTPTQDPLNLARKHAAALDIPNASTMSTADLVDSLRGIPASDLISSVTKLKFFDVDSLTVYRTVVEPQDLPGAFLTDTPWNLLKSGQMVKLPLMVGLVEAEGAVRAAAIVTNSTVKEALNDDIENLIPQLMELQLKGDDRENFTKRIISRYLPGTGLVTLENQMSFIQMYSDRSFNHPHYKLLSTMTADRNLSIFTYYFGYRGEHTYSTLFTGTATDFGVVHCDDLIYLFESPLLFPSGLNVQDKEMSRKLVDHYVTFAQNKSPWSKTKRVGDKIGPYLSLADETEKYYTDWEMVQFWDQTKEF